MIGIFVIGCQFRITITAGRSKEFTAIINQVISIPVEGEKTATRAYKRNLVFATIDINIESEACIAKLCGRAIKIQYQGVF